LQGRIRNSPEQPFLVEERDNDVADNPSSSSSGSSGLPAWQIAIDVIIPVVVLGMLGGIASCILRQMPQLQEQCRIRRKRASGRPRKGFISIAVTDIQGYTNFMRTQPDAMMQVCGKGRGACVECSPTVAMVAVEIKRGSQAKRLYVDPECGMTTGRALGVSITSALILISAA
jgi:hypothetical protein